MSREDLSRDLETWIYEQDFDLDNWADIRFNATQDFIAEFIELKIKNIFDVIERIPLCKCSSWAKCGTIEKPKGNHHHPKCEQYKL